MTGFLDGLPSSVKVAAAAVTGLLVVVAGLKTGAINVQNSPSPSPTTTISPSPTPVEVINIRLNIRDEATRKSIPNVKVEIVYLGGSTIEYTDSEGFIDLKNIKTSTTKIFLSKDGFLSVDRQLDPNLNIPQDRNLMLYLSPNKKDDLGNKPIPSSSNLGPIEGVSKNPSPVISSTPIPSVSTSSKVSPEDFVRLFYKRINNRDLETAWNMLSKKRRDKQEKGFESFREWWGDTVQQVNLKSTRLVRENNGRAEVEADTSYIINKKEVDEKPIVFRLAINAEKNDWEMLSKDEL